MEKYTALLMPAYLSGFVITVLLIPMLTPAPGIHDDLFYLPITIGLPVFLIGGALAGILTIFFARGISYLFIESPQ